MIRCKSCCRSGTAVLPEAVSNYLCKRSAAGPWFLDLEKGGLLPGAIVIPSFAESAWLPHTLDALVSDTTLAESGLAVVFVINNRPDATPEEKEDNRLSLGYLHGCRSSLPFATGIVDAFSPGFELPLKDGGVGVARKLGHDLLLPRLDYEKADPLIISLDADTIVRPGYAAAVIDHFRSASQGGGVIPFAHLPAGDAAGERAIERYELFIRCYVAGLQYAGSPYAFHTVGSAMACRASAYLKCGGMNRRKAGEDFYFLQSLAKTSGVAQVRGTTVYPSPRRSSRVPFGTGRAVGQLLDQEPGAVMFYPPECYTLLKVWLQTAREGCAARAHDLPDRGTVCSALLGEFLSQQGFAKAWSGFLGQHSTAERLENAFHGWFDAFRTLKLFHFLAERGMPRTEPAALLQSLPEAWGGPGLSLRERLELLRRIQGARPA